MFREVWDGSREGTVFGEGVKTLLEGLNCSEAQRVTCVGVILSLPSVQQVSRASHRENQLHPGSAEESPEKVSLGVPGMRRAAGEGLEPQDGSRRGGGSWENTQREPGQGGNSLKLTEGTVRCDTGEKSLPVRVVMGWDEIPRKSDSSIPGNFQVRKRSG